MMARNLVAIIVCSFGAALAGGQTSLDWEDPLTVRFGGGYGQVEVGGPYVGLEFHESRPLPARVSFYSPVANSIDLSTDYWKRGESRPVVIGIRVDDGPRRWLGKSPWEYSLSPHRVRFSAREGELSLRLAYDFCLNEPAAVMSLTVRNSGSGAHAIEVYTHTAMVLRSCQSYARFDSAETRHTSDGIVASFDERALGEASVALQNAGISPVSWTSDASALALSDTGWSSWITGTALLAGTLSPPGAKVRSAAAFLYRLVLQPGDSATIIQLLSSGRRNEIDRTMKRLNASWRAEVARYDSAVRSAASRGVFQTGDPWTDHAVSFAKALLASNQHFLDGAIVPMPCPAEYNFMFTHDILLTDLSAIVFDAARVKRDLTSLLSHAKDSVLPHAYYWKDDSYITEYCAPGNWNHLWFILATASYLRHTFDTTTVVQLMPIVSHGLALTLSRRRGNVMVGNEPDWWDFGHAEGARAYLTILTIRALEEYIYLGAMLGMEATILRGYDDVVAELRRGLSDELWDDATGYLLNSTGGLRDRHIYMGPLLAAAFGTLPAGQSRRLLQTARAELLDHRIGVRTVAPADFHTDSVKAFYNVKGNEAGDPYLYANGGVWYLGNAWYAWALQAVEGPDSAFAFYRRSMTVDGIAQSPRGQPALYEYRFSDPGAPDFGWVDKPTMMWSAGFCIGTAYRMIGVQEGPWNIAVGGALPAALHSAEVDYVFGSSKRIRSAGRGATISEMMIDGALIPSRVLPLEAAPAESIDIRYGPVRYPYLDAVNAILHAARIDTVTRSLSLTLSSFAGHRTAISLISPWDPESVRVNGQQIAATEGGEPAIEGARKVLLEYHATEGRDLLTIQFKKP